MNKTVLAVIVLLVIVGIAGFLFYDAADEGGTVVDKADQMSPAPGGGAAPPP